MSTEKPKSEESKYATVVRDGFRVPLISIPKDAVIDECQLCGQSFPFEEMAFSSKGHLLCPLCRD